MANENNWQLVIAEAMRLLREERERQKISMNQLAERSGLSQPMISFLERGIRNPTLETLLRIAHVLKVDLGSVITRACKANSKKG